MERGVFHKKSHNFVNKGSVCRNTVSGIAVFAGIILLAVPIGALAQNNSKGPGGGPPDPGGLVQTVTINVPMPAERLNQQYTSDFIYNLPYAGGTVTFAAYYDPVNPDLGITDVEALNGYLARIQADTLMTFTSASTNTGQMWCQKIVRNNGVLPIQSC